MTDVPYDELDPPVVALVRALNDLPGIKTLSSCGGHEEPPTLASVAVDQWYVEFRLDAADWDALVAVPTPEAWVSLEFLAWLVNDMWRAGRTVALAPFARPPFVNLPGRMLLFRLSGYRGEGGAVEAGNGSAEGVEPDDLAEYVAESMGRYYVPAEDAWPDLPPEEGE